MAKVQVIAGSYHDIVPDIGPVHIKVHAAARGIRARWDMQELCVTLPKGTPVSVLDNFFRVNAARINALRPRVGLVPGVYFEGPLADFTLVRSDEKSKLIRADIRMQAPLRGKRINYTIRIPSLLSDETVAGAPGQKALNDILTKCALHGATRLLIPFARDVAARLGCKPAGWKVSRATRRFGSCSSGGEITLSPKLMFVDLELVDYVVCHELAHLSHMNHSAAFHRLCDAYCGGREAELRARLRACAFPIR